ncbi:hypothetical protein MA16_Dca013828 [Dendrobium catenatum]|uniref:Probable magnesium transporter n=2 Tax=Dendrobium TaxID=37818 RepID=A0A2I0WXM5_9ASPA|nr:hypothetical protein MA16_Dca013828 [Dendrobium catenatum]
MFTILTILASAIMFKDWSGQSASDISSEMCGFITVLSGTVVLHSTRVGDPSPNSDLYMPLPPKISWHVQGNGEFGKHKNDDLLAADFITLVRQDYFT